jgi:hypothetical protein
MAYMIFSIIFIKIFFIHLNKQKDIKLENQIRKVL